MPRVEIIITFDILTIICKMIASNQLRKPENWQDFERLCKKLWGEIWKCPTSIKRNGRSGQKQNGVDIYGIPENESDYFGIQCKGKDDYSNSKLTTDEIDAEIKKATFFVPPLKKLIFATTANKDAQIEEYIRVKNLENIKNHLFAIDIASWEDIVDFVMEQREVFNWYANNCQYKDSSDVTISFNGEQTYSIHPKYIKKITTYKLRKPDPFYLNNNKIDPSFLKFMQDFCPLGQVPRKIDYRWCKINISIENSGSTTIRDYKLYLFLDNNIQEFDTGVEYINSALINGAEKAAVNAQIRSEQELFSISKPYWGLRYQPKDQVLAPTDHKYRSCYIIPKDGVDVIRILCDFKSGGFAKKLQLEVKVSPDIEDSTQIIEVETEEEIKEQKIEILPKITQRCEPL